MRIMQLVVLVVAGELGILNAQAAVNDAQTSAAVVGILVLAFFGLVHLRHLSIPPDDARHQHTSRRTLDLAERVLDALKAWLREERR